MEEKEKNSTKNLCSFNYVVTQLFNELRRKKMDKKLGHFYH